MDNNKNGVEIHVFASAETNDCLRLVNHKTERTVPIHGINSTFTEEDFFAKEKIYHRLAVNDSHTLDFAILFTI